MLGIVMKRMRLPGILLAALGVATVCAEIHEGDLDELQRECRVSLDEPWRTIPWKISLLEAQRLSVEEKKPIFIWAMDGHPLGCT